MSFLNGTKVGFRFCAWSLEQGRPLPDKIPHNPRFNVFQRGFVAAIDSAHILAEGFAAGSVATAPGREVPSCQQQ
ncbi:hypothetical protein [Marinobacterium iners]|uniref:Uncharacterized protein n=1 Tax=Marinobacterium iners DSM 11526 TaxID=1122198 RepID=A0A1H4H8V2_9GAMM|nr:hypothetical protein [Marinobacterium iners]SEB17860.1 hypothetical protein SAMN02745729_13118 [Marinobacterium iners DSM 11526]